MSSTYPILIVFDDETTKTIDCVNDFRVSHETKLLVVEINHKSNVIVNWDKVKYIGKVEDLTE